MRTCAIDGCERPHCARGWCKKHYYRWYHHGDPEQTAKVYDHPAVCSIEGCELPYRTKGMCATHYARWMRTGNPLIAHKRNTVRRICSVEDCERRISGFGYCAMHLHRVRRFGSTDKPSSRTEGTCEIADCGKPISARGLCVQHYARLRIHGDPLAPDKRAAKQRLRAVLDWRNLEDVGRLDWTPVGGGYLGTGWPEHPNATKNGRVAHHVAVMAAVIGRPLTKGEFPHHKNGVRSDNRPENLELWVRAHPPGQRVSELIAFAAEILERYRDDMQLWPEHLRA